MGRARQPNISTIIRGKDANASPKDSGIVFQVKDIVGAVERL